ncbi:7TM-DISM domain-containing protein [Oligoflexus tunisiensis]|uniref:7TM-DISM domain-containing protein n=1 Tax=Oligoflexus tunisiensis TaxID=708132 RepID=UPI00114C9D4F|nr:7TM diverse intracellular signaling domain-containing protein [Oligoflexus tunisiensis]
MKFLLALILYGILSSGMARGAGLSTFVWDSGTEALEIQGPLSWSAARCDFTQTAYDVRNFPIFSNKGPSGKPVKDPTGSYCFEIQLPSAMRGQMLHFSLIRLFGNAELLINQQRVWHQNSTTGPQRLALLHEADSDRLQVELRLQCNESPSCGFRGLLHVRDQRQGARAELVHLSFELLAVTGIAACLFYHLVFAFLRRRSSTAFFLSFNAMTLILRLVLTGQGQLQYVLGLSESWYWRLELISVLVLLPSTLSLVRSVFETEAPPLLPTLGWSICGAASLFLVLDARIFPFLLIIAYAMVFLNVYNFAVVGTRAVQNRRTGAIVFIICALTTVISTLFESMNARMNVEMHTAVQPLSYLATMIFHSVLLATRINDAFNLAEQQETEITSLKERIESEILSLDQKILERTTELRTIFQSISTGILLIKSNEQDELQISSAYSDHLQQTIGFEIEAWHELHAFFRRMRLPHLPPGGQELAAAFREHMQSPRALDVFLEEKLGGLRVFQGAGERVKHLKFKWIPIMDADRVKELFLFVFDVSASIAMQELAESKALEIEALRELTALAPERLAALDKDMGRPSLPHMQLLALQHELPALQHALDQPFNAAQLQRFLRAYHKVLALLAERQKRASHQPFQLEGFLHLPDWENLPVDARRLYQELLAQHEKLGRCL